MKTTGVSCIQKFGLLVFFDTLLYNEALKETLTEKNLLPKPHITDFKRRHRGDVPTKPLHRSSGSRGADHTP